MKTNLVLILKKLVARLSYDSPIFHPTCSLVLPLHSTPSNPFSPLLDQLQSEIQQFSQANEQLRCDVEALHKSSTAEEQSYLTSVHHLQEQIQQLQTIVSSFFSLLFLTLSATIATTNARKSKKLQDGSKNSRHVPRKASSRGAVCTTRSKNSAETSASSRVCVRRSSLTALTGVLPRFGWRATRQCV